LTRFPSGSRWMAMGTEKYVLSRDRIAVRSTKAVLARMRKNPVSVERRDAYLAILKATGDMGAALRGSRLSFLKARQWRTHDEDFRKQESECCDAVALMQSMYLEALRTHYGNRSKARREVEVTKADVDEWLREPEFERKEQEVYEYFVDEANEQNTRLIVGAETNIRDPQHLRWALPKIDKRWEDAPKVLEHRYGGSVTVKDTRERIKELMRPEDVVDAEITEE